jgi:hypothetical protein
MLAARASCLPAFPVQPGSDNADFRDQFLIVLIKIHAIGGCVGKPLTGNRFQCRGLQHFYALPLLLAGSAQKRGSA